MSATLTKAANPVSNCGALLLVDIPGYAKALQAIAAAHGEAVLAFTPSVTALLDGVIAGLVPPYRVSTREGDRVVLYGPATTFSASGDEVIDSLSYCYAEFRRRRNEAAASMACHCTGCTSIRALELRIVLHWGSYGPGVTMAQLLIHDTATDHAYVLVTKPAAEHLGIALHQPVSYTSAVKL